MNKICSFLIIIIIIYVTYDYCSRITEGQTVAKDIEDRNTEREEEDKSVPDAKCVDNNGTPLAKKKSINKNDDNIYPCVYENVSCKSAMDKITADDWEHYWGNPGAEGSYKKQCNLCVQGSKVDGNTRFILANVGNVPGTKVGKSNFADSLCDAMAIKCDNQVMFANNKQDGWPDCAKIDSTTWEENKLNKVVCAILTSSIIQFFLNFLGGVSCTLQIMAHTTMAKIDCFGCCHSPGSNDDCWNEGCCCKPEAPESDKECENCGKKKGCSKK